MSWIEILMIVVGVFLGIVDFGLNAGIKGLFNVLR